MPEFIATAFISYCREDEATARKLATSLQVAGVQVFFDRNSIRPGEGWLTKIRDGIQNHACFIPLFSGSYQSGQGRFMELELQWCFNVVRTLGMPTKQVLPVRISECDLPDMAIKEGVHLRDLQWIDYFVDPDLAVFRLLQQIIHIDGDYSVLDELLRPGMENHLERKIAMLAQIDAPLTAEARAEIFALFSPRIWFESLDMIYRSIKGITKLSNVRTNRWQDTRPGGPVLSVTVAVNRDYGDILELLPYAEGSKSPYVEFIKSDLIFLHGLDKWESRSYAHWLIKLDNDGTSADLFFWPSFWCRYHDLINHHLAMRANLQTKLMGTIVPGSLVGEADIGAFLAQRMEADLLMWNSGSMTQYLK